jgi:YidC/Oxa1 family membrane protein insertase
MDRKAWIVVILCSIGIALNAWFASKNPPPAPAAAVSTAAPAKAADGSAPAAINAATAPAAPATPALPEETHTITRGSVTWSFTTLGGGISKILLAGTDKITLNEHGKEPIGALRREAAGNDPVAYKIVAKSGKGITFEGTSVEGITIRKEFVVAEGEGSDEHLINLNVTLTNTGKVAHKSEEYYLYTGAANSISPDEALKPAFFWNDAGDAHQRSTAEFKEGGFLGFMSTPLAEVRSSHTRLRYSGVMSRFYVSILSHEAEPDKPGKVWASSFLLDHSKDQFKDKTGHDSDHAIQAAMGMPPIDLAPGAAQTEKYSLYAGPKEYVRLDDLGGQRDFVMFYGMFSFISKPLNRLMRWMHDFSGNWGLAIILMTIIIRTILWPLQAKSQYSMKRMGKLAPLM